MADLNIIAKSAKNWLKKTGDVMTAGFLTLFQDPTLALHAATKQYVDAQVGNISAGLHKPYTSNQWYGPTFAVNSATASLVNNQCRLSPMWIAGSFTCIGLGFHAISFGAGHTYRVGIYQLNNNTLFPVAGAPLFTFAWVPGAVTAWTTTAIAAQTFTGQWIGLAVRVEGIVSDTLEGLMGNQSSSFGFYAPYGRSPSAATPRGCGTLLSSDLAAGAMPDGSTFATVNESINYDHGLFLQKQ